MNNTEVFQISWVCDKGDGIKGMGKRARAFIHIKDAKIYVFYSKCIINVFNADLPFWSSPKVRGIFYILHSNG